jgi:sugar lactone lactonase YvrE
VALLDRDEMSEAIPSTTEQATLGEGLRWDAERGELLRVDITAGQMFRDRIADDGTLIPIRTYQLPGTVCAVAPIEGARGWVLAAGRGFARLDPDGAFGTIADVESVGSRMNDGAADPRGRFWAGTVADRSGAGVLYRLERDGRIEAVLDGLTTSNGIGWSPDGRTMYLADSGPRVVHAFDFDVETGATSRGRVLVEVPAEIGSPDGLTVDADGDLWVAIWGGGRIHRYSADGSLREVLAVPAVEATSCAFAGPGLDRLYVTTATEDWTDDERRGDPKAGLVYRFDTDATGRPADPFRPDPAWWSAVTEGR